MKGTVAFFSDYRGYGFIVGADRIDYFVHVSQVNVDGDKNLVGGQEVTFTPIHTRRGPQAGDVSPIASKTETSSDKTTVSLKKNPFTPQHPITSARRFAGRRESLINSIDALYNNKNVLIQGPRGIGKSSLAYQLLYLAQGEEELLKKSNIDLGDFQFNYLCGDHRCLAGNELSDICNGLLTTLYQRTFERLEDKKQKTKIGVDLKLISYSKETETVSLRPSDISLEFITRIEEAMTGLRDHIQIVFLIDEIDVLDPDVDLASFLKVTTEKAVIEKRMSLSFVVSGVTGTITDLLSQHHSVSRLFENLTLPKMQNGELEEIIDSALSETQVSITPDAKNEIVSLSNQFPQPVHLLGYHAFKLDSDRNIDITDVRAAKSFIVLDIKRQDFESRFENIAAGAMTEIARVMAQAPLDTVNISYLKANLRQLDEDKIVGTMGNLMKRGIVERPHRNAYRLVDPLFKIYLRWLFGMSEL